MKIGQYEQTDRRPLTLDDLRYGDILCLTRVKAWSKEEYWVFVDINNINGVDTSGVNKRRGLVLSGRVDHLLNDALKISEYVRENPPHEDEYFFTLILGVDHLLGEPIFSDYIVCASRDLGIPMVGCAIDNERLEKWKAEILIILPFSSAEGIKIG